MCKLKYALILLCVLLCSTAVWSTEAHATAEDSTLTVEYIHEETPIEDTTVAIYLVATWDYDTFTLTESFDGVGLDLNVLESPSEWREEGEIVAQYIQDNDCELVASQVTNSVGRTTFTKLEAGVYYVDVADMDYEDGTLISDPVLVTLPLYTGETNSYTYHVIMEPKVAYEETPTPTPTPTTPNKPKDPDDPDEPDEPEVFEVPEDPDTPDTPDDPEEFLTVEEMEVPLDPFFFDIFDLPVPLAGTSAWLILPMALLGAGLILFSLFGLGKRGRKS